MTPARVLVTGGESGIGAATVRRFTAGGARTVSLDLRAPTDRRDAVPVDLGDPAAVAPAVAEAAQRLGGLDVVVCAAAIDHHGTVEETTAEDWDRVLGVNLRGVFLTARAAIPHLRSAGGGAIVVVASQLAFVAQPRASAYCCAKSAVVQLARVISLDHGHEGIRANAVCPGPTQTPMLDAHVRAAPDPEAERQAVLRQQVHGRFVTADEIAEAIWYLASPGAASTLGASLVVDGGYTIH